MTDAETRLWYRLRAGRLSGLKFRRQAPLGVYVVDFICPAALLIVEVDGGQHGDRIAYDAARSAWLERRGFRVIRFWNSEVMANMESVLAEIAVHCTPSPRPSP